MLIHVYILIFYLLSTLISLTNLSSFEPGTVIVQTGLGAIRGYSNGMSWQFLGIPYAQPPINDLRWSDPQPVRPWSGILDGAKHPPGCPQDCFLPPGSCPISISEDCLFLNIYTPLEWSPEYSTSYDVMLFIHGGSFISGGAGCQLYDGRYLMPSLIFCHLFFNSICYDYIYHRQPNFGKSTPILL